MADCAFLVQKAVNMNTSDNKRSYIQQHMLWKSVGILIIITNGILIPSLSVM